MPLCCTYQHYYYRVEWGRRTSDLDVRVVRRRVVAVLDHSTHAMRVESILELPEGVSGKIEADEERLSPRKAEGFPFEPRPGHDSRLLRHNDDVIDRQTDRQTVKDRGNMGGVDGDE